MTKPTVEFVFRIPVRGESDIAVARCHTRQLAQAHGFALEATESLVTAVSEIARNALIHASGGYVDLGTVRDGQRFGISAIVRDDGPGISNVADAMRDGFTTGDGLGLGLPSARRLVDDFEIDSVSGAGTTVSLRKWRAIARR